jgi:hypothetical protein
MAEQKIQLRRLRDFGENFNDTFLFLRQNLKPLLRSFFAISSIFMVCLAIFYGINQSRSFSMIGAIFKGNSRSSSNDSYANVLTIEYFMYLLFLMLTFVSMEVVLAAYIKYYVENDGRKPTIDDIWVIFRRYFFKVFGYGIIFTLVTIVGFVFCLAPGFYFWVVFAPFPLVIMLEEADFTETYERCLELVKENFWSSFAIYIVAYLIYSISHGIIDGVGSIILGLSAYFSTKDVSTSLGIATSFLSIFSYCFYIVFFISVALNYFSLVEKRDGTGLLSRIQQIGSRKNNPNNSEEQY